MFSYNEYRNMISLIHNHLPIVDFTDVTDKTDKFCVLRHDIEFSIDRAYELAKVEKKLPRSSGKGRWRIRHTLSLKFAKTSAMS